MKSFKEIMQAEKITVPNFEEPKGVAFEKAMFDISKKIGLKIQKKNGSLKQIKTIEEALNRVNAQILMSEDEFEEMTFKKRKQELQNELENMDDFSGLNVQEYADKLLNNPAIQKLEAEAKAEYKMIFAALKEYESEMVMAIQSIQRFTADVDSVSHYRTGRRVTNIYQ